MAADIARTILRVNKFFKLFIRLVAALCVVSTLVLIGTVAIDPKQVGIIYLALININLIFAIVVVALVSHKIITLILQKKQGIIGTRLHLRLVTVFSTFAIIPLVVVSLFSGVLLNQGIEKWFSNRVTTALEGSLEVAQAYMRENENNLQLKAEQVARDFALSSPTFMFDHKLMADVLETERKQIFLSEMRLYDSNGVLLATTASFTPSSPPEEMVNFIRNPYAGGASYVDERLQQMVAVVPVNEDMYLYASKAIDPAVLNRMASVRQVTAEFSELYENSAKVRLIFLLFLVLLAVSLLGAAVFVALSLANRITRPVTELVQATNRMSDGDLSVRIPPLYDDELGILTQSFNRMVSRLKSNDMLIESKNKEISDRRRITDTVLSGVTSGVIGLDNLGVVLMANNVAFNALGVKKGETISHFSEEIGDMVQQLLDNPQPRLQKQLRITHEGEDRTLLVRVVPQMEVGRRRVHFIIITFDDITDLMQAQTASAWADVAQRIAHEIKNPLTPIQLSAERLARRYLKQLPAEDKDLFEQLTSTIVRQVEEMRRMVNEFSDFARMPAAQMVEQDVVSILDEIVLLQKAARPDISFEVEIAEDTNTLMNCDQSQLSRVFTNIIQNAVNAIEEDEQSCTKNTPKCIKVVVEKSQDDKLIVKVVDNGKGLPNDVDTDKLFDPYVTTRKKGTGLGLAIVRRVVDEHGGQIRLMRREQGGTCVEMTFPQITNT